MENFEHIHMIGQPRKLKIDLHPHQLASVYNMEKLEREQKIQDGDIIIGTTMGVNANITGYGKTLEMISLILRDKMEWDLSKPFVLESTHSYSGNRIVRRQLYHYEKNNTTLVLANQSIVNQWVKEFEYTDLRVSAVTSRKLANTVNADEYDVLIATPTMYNRLVERYNDICWKRFIFDEPGHLRVPAMRKILAGFTWFVTATPSSILTQHRNCRSSFMYTVIGESNWYFFEPMLDTITIKNPDDFVLQSFQMPPTHHNYYTCYSSLYQTLKGMVNSRIIAMIDANNIDGAIQALGGNKTSNVTELVRNKKLEELEEISSKIRIYTMRADELRLTQWKERETRVTNQLNELDKRFESLLTGDCTICYSKLSSPVMEPACQNLFCAKCLLTWLQQNETCPMCRQKVDTQNLVYITSDGGPEENKRKVQTIPTKEKTIIDIIKKRKDGKFIVFSSFNETFNTICNLFKANDISFLEVKGSIATVEKNIQKFKDGHIQVIFLNSKFHGAGLNLQEATDVIIYHKMDADLLRQVLGRPNRIGRTEPLQVHHLVYK